MLAKGAFESMARQPEIEDKIRGAMIIVAAFIEGFTFFALAIIILQVLGSVTADSRAVRASGPRSCRRQASGSPRARAVARERSLEPGSRPLSGSLVVNRFSTSSRVKNHAASFTTGLRDRVLRRRCCAHWAVTLAAQEAATPRQRLAGHDAEKAGESRACRPPKRRIR